MPTLKNITIAPGQSRLTSAYHRFLNIRQRCLNPRSQFYRDYGGRGIRICEGWSTFEQFYQDTGQPPAANYSLDRKDNNGHYSCGHCRQCLENNWPQNWRWATPKEQSNNTRANVRITHQGETLTIREWSQRLGVSEGTLCSRRSRGLRDAEILAPVKKRRPFERGSVKRPAVEFTSSVADSRNR